MLSQPWSVQHLSQSQQQPECVSLGGWFTWYGIVLLHMVVRMHLMLIELSAIESSLAWVIALVPMVFVVASVVDDASIRLRT